MKSSSFVIPFYLETDSPRRITVSQRQVPVSYPLHGHDYYELELITGGRGVQWLNNTCVPLAKGSFYLVSPWDIHRLQAEESLCVYSLKFLQDVANFIDLQDVQCAYAMNLTEADYSAILNTLSEIEAEYGANAAYCEQRMSALLTLALVKLLREGARCLPMAYTSRMREALRYIQNRYADSNLRLKDVADACGLSACHFSTTFHDIVGCGFSEYLTNYRIQRACALLLNDKASVTQIAYEVGYASLPHFFRVFHIVTGYTPAKYRQMDWSAVSGGAQAPAALYVPPAKRAAGARREGGQPAPAE